jgi:purine-nucleoside phosphorylase
MSVEASAMPSLKDALLRVRSYFSVAPRAAIILGSGVKLFDALYESVAIPYTEIFGVAPGVAGHSGVLSVGKINEGDDAPIAVFRGRYHLYEGHDWNVVTMPTRLIVDWGIPFLFMTNAAGALNTSFAVGDLMCVEGFRDHLHPQWRELGLIGALAEPSRMVRSVLSDRLFEIGERIICKMDSPRKMRKGILACLHGPNYETMAEVKMLQRLGADAVGMSTAPELETVINSATKFAALSLITNVWQENVELGGHTEVLEASQAGSQVLEALFTAYLSPADK